jgi:hypothetical protein
VFRVTQATLTALTEISTHKKESAYAIRIRNEVSLIRF